MANDSDPDGDARAVSADTQGAKGAVVFEDVPDDLRWFRPAAAKEAAVDAALELVGSPWVEPGTGQLPLGFAPGPNNARVTLSGGGLAADIVSVATLDAGGAITPAAPNALGMTLKILSNGNLTGAFLHPVNANREVVRGVAFQERDLAGGGVLHRPQRDRLGAGRAEPRAVKSNS